MQWHLHLVIYNPRTPESSNTLPSGGPASPASELQSPHAKKEADKEALKKDKAVPPKKEEKPGFILKSIKPSFIFKNN
jgi:hypothetical protein